MIKKHCAQCGNELVKREKTYCSICKMIGNTI